MTRLYVRLLIACGWASALLPCVTIVSSVWSAPGGIESAMGFLGAVGAGGAAAAGTLHFLLRRFEGWLDAEAGEQAAGLDVLPAGWLKPAIFVTAAMSLLLELAMIRWQGTVFEFFAFYKNFGLLACFAGLGLGYALAGRERIYAIFVIPLLTWQFCMLLAVRHAVPENYISSLRVLPVLEQLHMGLQRSVSLTQGAAVYFFLAVVFLLTALTFVPVGQLCGRVMQREQKLTAYGLNLLGSLFGVAAMFGVSAAWLPPIAWFAPCLMVIVVSQRRDRVLSLAAAAATAAIIALGAAAGPLWQRIYSPYQLLEVNHSKDGQTVIRAAGHYYQRVHNLAADNPDLKTNKKLQRVHDYYELPYKIHPRHDDVAVVGSGTGNDVAAALRSGAQRVDAIEIDPAILLAGRAYHPEQPYADRRVRGLVNDARTFLRNTDRKYDMVVYGLLDSHTLLSHASSVRLDSFVYTVEGLREARARLKDDGVLSLSFAVLNDELARKIYLMLQEAFDGQPPVCVWAGYDGSMIYLQAKNGRVELPAEILAAKGFEDRTALLSNAAIAADVSTDDWPFFYMPRRIYPISYLGMLAIVLVLSWLLARSFLPGKPGAGNLPFFFLGAGFMLVETKGITELGLTFGNTWQVIGMVIAGILTMAFVANLAVQRFKLERAGMWYALLLASLAAGWLVAGAGGFPSTTLGRIATVTLLTSPLLFSGVVFSTLLRNRGEISGAMAANLLGAMLGGMLEYNSMYFGFRFLYLVAMVFYALAFASAAYADRKSSVAQAALHVKAS